MARYEAKPVIGAVEVAVGDVVELVSGKVRKGRVVKIGDANLKLDTVKGYVPRGKVLRINPASQVMMCPVEFFNMTRTEIRA